MTGSEEGSQKNLTKITSVWQKTWWRNVIHVLVKECLFFSFWNATCITWKRNETLIYVDYIKLTFRQFARLWASYCPIVGLQVTDDTVANVGKHRSLTCTHLGKHHQSNKQNTKLWCERDTHNKIRVYFSLPSSRSIHTLVSNHLLYNVII